MGLVGYALISFEADKHGCGIHQWLVHESDFREFSKVNKTGDSAGSVADCCR